MKIYFDIMKKGDIMKVYFTEYKFVWLDENTFWQHEKKVI